MWHAVSSPVRRSQPYRRSLSERRRGWVPPASTPAQSVYGSGRLNQPTGPRGRVNDEGRREAPRRPSWYFNCSGTRFSTSPPCGAGGNRTPVHQALSVRDTTIPDSGTDAVLPAGRLAPVTLGRRLVFPGSHRSFPTSSVFADVIPRFCCRAAVDRPRAAFLLTMSLHYLRIRRRERTAGWQFFLVPRLASLSNSGRTLGQRY